MNLFCEEMLKPIADMYNQNLNTYGPTPRSVGWKDGTSQRLRFEKLTQILDWKTASKGIAVNDLGCGYGAMFQYLDKIPSVQLLWYHGYDISEEMLVMARRLMPSSRAKFIQGSRIAHKADYSFASGPFHVKQEINHRAWTDYMKQALMNLAAMSVQGFAFNAMTTYVGWKQKNLYYADPFLFFDFCKRRISRYVTLLHDYPLFEWTMLVHKED